jgi:copper resistance protein D
MKLELDKQLKEGEIMSWEIHQFFLGVHIFLGIIWVGGILFVGWGVYPAAKTIKVAEQRQFLLSLMKRTHLIFTLVGAGVITTGILLGTVLGPIKSFDILWNTAYGNLWLTALIIGLITLLWGVFVGYRQTMKVLSDDTLWKLAEKGYSTALNQAMFTTAVLESVEIIGFIALLTCMMII